MEGGRRNDVMVALVDDGFWIGGLIREGKGWELGVGQVWGRKDDTSYVSSSDACLLACFCSLGALFGPFGCTTLPFPRFDRI